MSESSSGQPSDTPAPAALPANGPAAPTREETAPFELSQEPVTPEGEGAPGGATATPAPAYEHLGELPNTYGTQSVYLVAYDPHQLFAYWDVDWTSGPNTPYTLHVCRADGTLEQQVDIVAAEAGRYLPVQTPGGTYFVELGRYGRDGRWHVVATSARVAMPPAGLAEGAEPKFATLPFHLSFQRLMELIQSAMGRQEDLTAALARLQEGDRPGLRVVAGTAAGLGPGPLETLELLLGQRFHVSSGGDSSGPSASGGKPLARDRHDVSAMGAFSSENLSSGGLSSGGGFGGASENLASGAFSFGLPGGSDTLAAYAAGLSSESLASFGGSLPWHLLASESSGSGGFGGGGSDQGAHDRADTLLRALESHLGMLGGLFSSLSSGSGGFGGS